MVEGVNIPGPQKPLAISSPRLPKGWQKKVIQRTLGQSAGKWDVFIENPEGQSFKQRAVQTLRGAQP